MHLPILLEGATKDTLIRLHNTIDQQEFIIDLDFWIEEFTFDPDFDLVKGYSPVVFSPEVSSHNTGLTIYPNPVNEQITIESNDNSQIDELEIFDLFGKSVKSYSPEPGVSKINLNINDLNRGVYMLRIKTNNEFITQKLYIR